MGRQYTGRTISCLGEHSWRPGCREPPGSWRVAEEYVPAFQWVFFDAGETLFQVSTPGLGFGQVLADLGYPLSKERLDAVIAGARSSAMTGSHVGPA